MEQFREAALTADVPLFVCIEATANPRGGDGPPDNAKKLRQSVYTNLAYGVKGVEWSSCRGMFKKNSVQLTKDGKDIAILNREMKTSEHHESNFIFFESFVIAFVSLFE